ncbi:MAG TPA: hypothetical protein VN783_02010 [Thermoanaerobaculia bacterium]|nr:hypothetical protein [Thermoanaerobaculia bacterium]
MKLRLALLMSAVAVALSLGWLGSFGPQRAIAAPAAAAPNPCAFPTSVVGSPAQTAWMIFVAANCPANQRTLTWETWIEQADLYPANGKVGGRSIHPKRLHGSPLAQVALAKLGGHGAGAAPSTESCNPMAAPPTNSSVKMVKTTICEEARQNPTTQAFIVKKGYQVRSGQAAAAKAGADIDFPGASIEVKVDWIPASDYSPAFTCKTPPAGVHVSMIDGECYAMAGMHISSKLLKDWIWATFEPQSLQTNPNRCITFGPCNDPFGSIPNTSNGGAAGFTKQTPQLKAMMVAAHLAPEFLNYRLDGVQTTFGTAANPTLLGNSIIEGENVGMTKGTASCISCHSVSSVEADAAGTDGIQFLPATGPVGPQFVVPAGWIARDFVWSLAVACPNGILPGHCTGSNAAAAVKKKVP